MQGNSEVVKTVTEISLKDMALQQIGSVSAGIAALTEQYAGKTYDVMSTAGMEAAKAARLAIRETRYKIPHIVKEKKQALKQIGDDIQAEGDRITTILFGLENPIHAQIELEQKRKDDIKAEKERIERERVAALRLRIDTIKALPTKAVGATADQIHDFMQRVEANPIGADFQEFAEEAQAAKDEAIATLTQMLASQLAADEEAARVKREQEAEAIRLADLAKKQEEEEREFNRVNTIKGMINRIREWPLKCIGLGSEAIQTVIDDSEMEKPCLEEDFQEFAGEAEEARLVAVAQMFNLKKLAEDTEYQKSLDLAREINKRKEDEEAQKAADELRKKEDAAAAEALLKEREKQAEENQKRLDEMTATHLSTLQAILAMAEDKTIKPPAALTGIIHLAKLGIERGQA